MADTTAASRQPEPAFAPEEVAAALAAALEVETAASTRLLRELGVALREGAADKPSAPGAQLLDLDGCICQLEVSEGVEEARWGTPFVPSMVLGGKVFPPPVSWYPDAVRDYLSQRAKTTARSDARARYLDFAWQRWRDGSAGKEAIEHYLSAASATNLSDIEAVGEGDDGLMRALDLTRRMKADLEPVRTTVLVELRRRLTADRTLSISRIVPQGAGLLAIDPGSALALADEMAAAVSGATSASNAATQLLEASARLAQVCGDQHRAKAHRLRLAALHEMDAGRAEGLARQHHLQSALRHYRDAGDKEAVERLRQEFEQAGQDAQLELHTISAETTISRDQIEAAVSALPLGAAPTFAAFLTLPWDLGMWPAWAEVQKERRDEEAGSIAALFSHVVLTADGRFQPEPDRDRFPKEFAHARDVRFFGKRTMYRAGIAHALYLPELRRRGHWSAPWVQAVLANVSADLAIRAEAAMGLYEAGQHWAALHSLVPVLETAVRTLSEEAGARRSSYTPHEGLRWASMETILKDRKIASATSTDFVAEFKALFLDGHGLNIRNNVAHGGASMESAETEATITVLTIVSIARYILARRILAAGAGRTS